MLVNVIVMDVAVYIDRNVDRVGLVYTDGGLVSSSEDKVQGCRRVGHGWANVKVHVCITLHYM